ncbi:GntR family transcriptional regulator [Aquincola sp. MAHUQ-54]|uniref:GntR family transcriptional regulator n=1 Tax=Aquincola agrisoli TaxID=3119538 RepID=A0AAW9QCY6_9BURK
MRADAHPAPADEAPTQQDAIYARLRQWVTVGRFLPGERLKIRTVAQQLGVGEMPVRAALQRLAAEGALVNVPHAGVIVPRLSVAEFDDLLQMRLLLEGEAAERGALRIDRAGRAALAALGRRMADTLGRADGAGYLAANEDFHVLLYRAAGSPLLFGLIDTLWLKAGPVSNQLFELPEAAGALNAGHDAALAALAANDPAGVRLAVEQDIFTAGQLIRQRLRSRDR